MNQPEDGVLPPHDLDAERSIVACGVNGDFDKVTCLEPKHFYSPAYRAVWEAMAALSVSKQPIDAVSVASRLRDTGSLQNADGAASIASLTYEESLSEETMLARSERIRDLWRLRTAIALCHRKASQGYHEAANPVAFLDSLEGELYHAVGAEKRVDVVTLRDGLASLYKTLSEPRAGGLRTYSGVDSYLGGMWPGDLIVLASRPGMGKTALACCLALLAAQTGAVVYIALEMPTAQLAARLAAAETALNLSLLRNGQMTQSDWITFVGGCQKLSKLPMWICDKPGLGLLECRSVARKCFATARHANIKPALLVIDYLQLMRGVGDSRQEEVASVSRGLKELAKTLDVPVLACAQLNRQVEMRPDKRPTMADLRESGSIEQDADVVMLMYRNGYYKPDDDNGDTDIIVGKNRNGPTGTASLKWIETSTRFMEAAHG